MPNLNAAMEARRALLVMWWRTPRYRAAVENLKVKKPRCDRCGRPASTALHCAEDYRQGYEHYTGVVERLECEAGCQQCNREEQRNRRACPACVRAYRGDPKWRIRYISFTELECFTHKPPEEQLRLRQRAVIKRRSRTASSHFPCRFRLADQGCRNGLHTGACDRSKETAAGCNHFEVRG